MTATVPIERIDLLARLYGGHQIVSRRRVPLPHRFFLRDGDRPTWEKRGEIEIPEFVVQGLVDAGVLVGKPLDSLWDAVRYITASREPLRRELLRSFPKGWGRCEKCGALLKLGATKGGKTLAPKHGHHFIVDADMVDGKRERKATPPCAGSGLPLCGAVYAAA